jgi:hypothetical protein
MPFYFKLSLTAFVCVLAVGYAMSTINIFFCTPVDKDLGIIASIGQRYTGSESITKLESKIDSTMKFYLKSEEERTIIMNWIDAGATKASYTTVEPILQKRCVLCHMSFAPLTSYKNVSKFTESDPGMSVQYLTKVSHIHIFGMATFFIFITVIFGFSQFNFYVKTVLMTIPFVAIILDILSFWLTKYNSNFALMIVVAGSMMGISFALLYFGILYDIWLRREAKKEILLA